MVSRNVYYSRNDHNDDMSGMNEHHDGNEHDHEAKVDKYKLPNIALN